MKRTVSFKDPRRKKIRVTLTIQKIEKRYSRNYHKRAQRLMVKWHVRRSNYCKGKTWDAPFKQNELNLYEFNFKGYVSSFSCNVERSERKNGFESRVLIFDLYEFYGSNWDKVARCEYNFGEEIADGEMRNLEKELNFQYTSSFSTSLFKKMAVIKEIQKPGSGDCKMFLALFIDCSQSGGGDYGMNSESEKAESEREDIDTNSANENSSQVGGNVRENVHSYHRASTMKSLKMTRAISTQTKVYDKIKKEIESALEEELTKDFRSKSLELNEKIGVMRLEMQTKKSEDYNKIRYQSETIASQKSQIERITQEIQSTERKFQKKLFEGNERMKMIKEKLERSSKASRKITKTKIELEKHLNIQLIYNKKLKEGYDRKKEQLSELKKKSKKSIRTERRQNIIRYERSLIDSRRINRYLMSVVYSFLCTILYLNYMFVVREENNAHQYFEKRKNDFKFIISLFFSFYALTYLGFKMGRYLRMNLSFLLYNNFSNRKELKTQKRQSKSESKKGGAVNDFISFGDFKMSIFKSVLFGIAQGVLLCLCNLLIITLIRMKEVENAEAGDDGPDEQVVPMKWENVFLNGIAEGMIEEIVCRFFFYLVCQLFIASISEFKIFSFLKGVGFVVNFLVSSLASVGLQILLMKKELNWYTILIVFVFSNINSYLFYAIEIIECSIISSSVSKVMVNVFFTS